MSDRQPTVDEAVKWLLRSLTEEYAVLSIKHYRDLYGDEYAEQIRAQLNAKWKGRK